MEMLLDLLKSSLGFLENSPSSKSLSTLVSKTKSLAVSVFVKNEFPLGLFGFLRLNKLMAYLFEDIKDSPEEAHLLLR